MNKEDELVLIRKAIKYDKMHEYLKNTSVPGTYLNLEQCLERLRRLLKMADLYDKSKPDF